MPSRHDDPCARPKGAHGPRPITLGLGLGLILACEVLLWIDVSERCTQDLPTPQSKPWVGPDTPLSQVAGWVAINMTALCWVGYLLVLDGLLVRLAWRRGHGAWASVRDRPDRFAVAFLTSVPVWCFFDWVNFAFLGAWQYHHLPSQPVWRYAGYLVAFGAITPAMTLTAQLYQHLGLRRLQSVKGTTIDRHAQVGLFVVGLVFVGFPFLVQAPVGTMTLWLGLWLVLDPVNHWLGAPSLIGDWQAGRWGRTVALMAAGATCGLLWEFWNYWAIAKWTYHLPFLGPLENHRYFEMPWVGLLGFLPFALECWVALNTILIIIQRLGVVLVQPLPDDHAII